MKLFKTYFIIAFCSLVFSIFAFVIYKFIIEPKLNPYPKVVIEEYKNKTGMDFDNRPRFKVYEDLLEYDSNVIVSIPPESYLINKSYKIKNKIFPISGASNTLTINCNENGYYSKYQSDRYGFNNPDSEWDKKEIEYMLLGDSFAHGFCVNRPNDIASLLRNLSKKSVLNLGYAGNGPLIEYATLKEYIKPNVKKIIWFYYEGNDIKDLSEEVNSEILIQYLTNYDFNQNLKNKQNEIDFTVKDYLSYHYNKSIRLYLSLKKGFANYFKKDKKKKKEGTAEILKNFNKIMKFTKRVSLENNSELFFVYLPEIIRYKKVDYKNNNYLQIKKIVTDLDITFIDIDKEVFQNETSPLRLFPFEIFPHYTIEGYNKVTKSVFKSVSK